MLETIDHAIGDRLGIIRIIAKELYETTDSVFLKKCPGTAAGRQREATVGAGSLLLGLVCVATIVAKRAFPGRQELAASRTTRHEQKITKKFC